MSNKLLAKRFVNIHAKTWQQYRASHGPSAKHAMLVVPVAV
jgi:hypothetical protein